MKKFLVLFLVFTCSSLLASSASMLQPKILLNDGSLVGPLNPMPVAISGGGAPTEMTLASETIGLITAIDAITTAIGNFVLASETIGLITDIQAITTAITNIPVTDLTGLEAAQASTTAAVNTVDNSVGDVETAVIANTSAVNNTRLPVSELATQTITLVANTSQAITSGITGSRKYIEIADMTGSNEFHIDYNGAAVIGSARRTQGGIYIEIPKGYQVNVIASTAFDLFVTEGGY